MTDTENKHKDHRTILLEWETPEFRPTPRGRLWFILAALLLTAMVVYGLMSGNPTMSVALILLAVVFMMIERREPAHVRTVITDMGIQYRGHFYPFHHINAFWIVYHPPHLQLLYLRIRVGRALQTVRIDLNHQKPQTVRKILIREVPEIEGAQEPTLDILARLLKFH